jgi:hypothetical protein
MRGGDEGMLSVEISTLRPTNVIYLDDSETMERLFKVCSRKANRCVELGDPIRARLPCFRISRASETGYPVFSDKRAGGGPSPDG